MGRRARVVGLARKLARLANGFAVYGLSVFAFVLSKSAGTRRNRQKITKISRRRERLRFWRQAVYCFIQ
jgi:hypothetical protein